MAFRWRADDGPFIVVFGYSIPSSTKNKKHSQLWTASDKTLWICACSQRMIKTIIWRVRWVKTRIILDIRPVWSEFSISPTIRPTLQFQEYIVKTLIWLGGCCLIGFVMYRPCIKRLIWLHQEPQTECFFWLVVLKNNPSVKVWHLFNFYRCHSNKKGHQNRLKKTNCHFGSNFRLWETDILKNRYLHS